MARHIDHRDARPRNPLRIAIWGIAACLLLLPLLAMQFTTEVAWTASDFVVFGAMLLVACGTYELATRMTGSTPFRAAVGVAVVAAFLLVWVNLAVGIIGSEGNRANLMYAGVLAVAVVGAALARFRAHGMARAMVAAAAAQALMAAVALAMGSGEALQLTALTAVFVALWLASAALFHKASRA